MGFSPGRRKKKNPSVKGWLRGGGWAFPGVDQARKIPVPRQPGSQDMSLHSRGTNPSLDTWGQQLLQDNSTHTGYFATFKDLLPPHNHKSREKAMRKPQRTGQEGGGVPKRAGLRVQRQPRAFPFPCSWAGISGILPGFPQLAPRQIQGTNSSLLKEKPHPWNKKSTKPFRAEPE